MRRKEMKARIAELEQAERLSLDKIGALLRADLAKATEIKELKEELAAEKEKYAALLERHVLMMENMAGFKVEGGE